METTETGCMFYSAYYQEPTIKRTSIYYTGPAKRTRPSPRGSMIRKRQATEAAGKYNPLTTVVGKQGQLQEQGSFNAVDDLTSAFRPTTSSFRTTAKFKAQETLLDVEVASYMAVSQSYLVKSLDNTTRPINPLAREFLEGDSMVGIYLQRKWGIFSFKRLDSWTCLFNNLEQSHFPCFIHSAAFLSCNKFRLIPTVDRC